MQKRGVILRITAKAENEVAALKLIEPLEIEIKNRLERMYMQLKIYL